MNILLVILKQEGISGGFYDFPIGLPSISAILKEANFNVHCVNLNNSNLPMREVLEEEIRAHSIDIACTSGLSPDYPKVRDFFQTIKSINREIITIGGGGLISAEPEFSIENLLMDIGVIGEGDITIVELITSLIQKTDLRKILGIVFKDDDENIIITPARPLIKDIDILPYPDYDGFGVDIYLENQRPNDKYETHIFDNPRFLPVISSRCCPYNCTFCYHPTGSVLRQRSIKSFFKEIKFYINKYDLEMLYIHDGLLAANEDRLRAFCAGIAPLRLKWAASLRADVINWETLKLLKESGMVAIGFGIESAADTVLFSMNKRETFSQIEQALTMAREVGIIPLGNFIFGDPSETYETCLESIHWWQKNPYYNINLVYMISYPGSSVYNHCLANKIITDKLDHHQKGCPYVNMTDMNTAELEQLHYEIVKSLADHRKYADVLEIKCTGYDQYREANIYDFTTHCPHCDHKVQYSNFFINDELKIHSICCRNCRLRFDIKPWAFPHLQQQLSDMRAGIRQLIATNTPVSIAPCLFAFSFIEYMQILDLNFGDLNLQFFLDADPRPDKLKNSPLSNYSVLKNTAQNISRYCKGHYIVVLPFGGSQSVVNDLLANGADKERLIYISNCTQLP